MAASAELQALEQELATEAARSDIECHTMRVDEEWHDIESAEADDKD